METTIQTEETQLSLEKLIVQEDTPLQHTVTIEIDSVDPIALDKPMGGAGNIAVSPCSDDETGSHGSGIKLGLFGSGENEDDFEEDDDLEKEYLHADDAELLEYQRQRSTPKIVIQEFEGEDIRSAAFKEAQEKQKKELFSQFYEQHLRHKYENATAYTLEDVAQHNSELDCWTVVEGRVYNIAPFVHQHPGGRKILQAAGIDGTEIFSKYP